MNYYQYWFKIEFEALKLISNIPFYSGLHWSAFFRNSLRRFTSKTASELELNVIPPRALSSEVESGEILSIYIATNEEGRGVLADWLNSDLASAPLIEEYSHFSLNESIKLSNWTIFEYSPQYVIHPKRQVKRLTLIFSAPLRLKRSNKQGGSFFDSFHFDLEEFIEKLAKSLALPLPELGNVWLKESSLLWTDMIYSKSIGGIMGGIVITGTISEELFYLLNYGQFYGLGKNRAFGFGFYYIKEYVPEIYTFNDSCDDIYSVSALTESLNKMIEGKVTGTDMSARELLEFPEYLDNLSSSLISHSYTPGEVKQFKIKKKNGYRNISAYSMPDKLVIAILSDNLDKYLSRIISKVCYSYRKGYGYQNAAFALGKEFKKGFLWGVKLDIENFFDSLSFSRIELILRAMRVNSAVISVLHQFFKKNLIQGNPLSPILSNIALVAFDDWFRRDKNLSIIRYADDIVILGKKGNRDDVMEDVHEILKKIGLRVKETKTEYFTQTSEIVYLGFNISESLVKSRQKKEMIEDTEWLPFNKVAETGLKPLYLSFSIDYVSSKGNSINIKSRDSETKVLWKSINRILILGKPRISGGLIYKAMKEQVPIMFLSIHGNVIGGYETYKPLRPVRNFFNNEEDYLKFQIEFVREIAITKIMNQYRVLKKNNISEPKIISIKKTIVNCNDIDAIRGKEGYCAKLYYEHFRTLVEPFVFKRRSYHPPIGEVNVLLSLGYTLLYRRVSEAIRFHEIDPFQGLFHIGRGTHEALASDIVEIFRYLVDRIVLALIHKKQITNDNFYFTEYSSYMRLDSIGFRTYIRYFEQTMKREMKYKDLIYTYEEWIDKSVVSLRNALILKSKFHTFRSL